MIARRMTAPHYNDQYRFNMIIVFETNPVTKNTCVAACIKHWQSYPASCMAVQMIGCVRVSVGPYVC